MTACPACATARTRTCGEYRNGCMSCVARAIARSLIGFYGLRDGASPADRARLKEAVARLMPNEATEAARRMVGDWWRLDHEQEGVSA